MPPAAERAESSVAATAVELESPSCGQCGRTAFEPVLRGCADTNYWCPGPRLDVVRCESCGLAQTRPRPTRESISHYYPPVYGSVDGLAEPNSPPSPLARASRIPYSLRYGDPSELPPVPAGGGRALDVGAGVGDRMAALRDLGWDVWGIEPSGELADTIISAFGFGPDRIIREPAESAEPQGPFDLVTFSHSLEHMHDPAAALAGARGWLAPGGELRVWVPNFGSWERRLFGRLWVALDVPRHLFHFTPSTLTAMVESAGFRVERIRPQFRGQSLSGTLAHAARRLGGRHPQYQPAGALYWAALPADRALTALGARANLELVARPA